jgi:hypothetical protein
LATRRHISEALAAKIGDLLKGAQTKIIEHAVETLLRKGAVIQAENLKLNVTDPQGKPVLQLTLTGTIKIEPYKGEQESFTL